MESICENNGISTENNNYTTIHKKYLVKGSLLFVLITLATFIFLFLINDSIKLIEVIEQLRFRYLIALLVLVVVDAYLDTSRYFVLAKKINPLVKYRLIFEANMADSFGGAITPFQAGGGPAMLFIMNRGGIDIANGLSIIVATYFMTLTFLLCASLISVSLLQYHFSNAFLDNLLTYSLTAFTVILSLIILSLFLPQNILDRIINHCKGSINHSNKIMASLLNAIIRLLIIIKEYNYACRQLIIRHPRALLNTLIVTILYYFNRFLLAYCLVYALGGVISFKNIVATQSLILFLPYFAPTPGGSGFTEISINGLMGGMLSGGILFSFIYFYRCLLYYIFVFLGGLAIAKELKCRISESRDSLPLLITEYSAE
ncbi:MAG: flippase-like domain-containing protein [Melioribacteraceae bacterium]|nr:flippase-like domain-containing protein [Melioribacteraceae bacterium]